MLKSTDYSGSTERAVQAAIEKAGEDLVMRKYLLDRRAEEASSQKERPRTVYINSSKEGRHCDAYQGESSGLDSESDLEEEDDPELRRLQHQRLIQLKERISAQKRGGNGDLSTIEESQFLSTVTNSEFCILHFFHNDFPRCEIMDKHLSKIAALHPETKFIRMDATKAPFFVQKLAIKVLPSVIMFENGVAFDRLLGFSDLGGTDEFSTTSLEKRLMKHGAIYFDSEQRKRKSRPAIARKLQSSSSTLLNP